MKQNLPRCPWANQSDLERDYHDTEWGVPCFDDRDLFELLILEGMQAGLSWHTVLVKRPRFREVFHLFDMETVASFDEHDIDRLLADPGIIRHRLKIESAVTNAQAAIRAAEIHGSLSRYLWQFVDGEPIVNHFTAMGDVPAKTAQSEAMSKQLKKDGFRFVGPTICYAFMQATGMVNDHLLTCFCRSES